MGLMEEGYIVWAVTPVRGVGYRPIGIYRTQLVTKLPRPWPIVLSSCCHQSPIT